MTNIKTRGFKDPAELRERLAELDDDSAADHPPLKDESEFHLAIEELQRDVDELRRRVEAISVRRRASPAPARHPWIRVFATAAATFVLGRVFSSLRLGAPGAVAVPLLATKVGDHIVHSVSHLGGHR